MNPRLSLLQPYPFERLKTLFEGIAPSPEYSPISLGIGEPKHATPELIRCALDANFSGLANYPATGGELAFKQACASWVQRRYGVPLDAATQVLPVNGSREALFSLTQTLIDPTQDAVVVSPNPFYQIYEGAALLAGARLHFAPVNPDNNFNVNWASVPNTVWEKTQLVFVCSPGNPTGAVASLADWALLFELQDRFGFVIASDECYSEIYFRDTPPIGALQAAQQLGRSFEKLIMITSLSKRSNAPGLRSGFVAGDAQLLKQFLLYRTYHGSAMSHTVAAASTAAWNDEEHVAANRAAYREKFSQVAPILSKVLDVKLPDAAFYLWAKIPFAMYAGSDTRFATELLAQYNVTVLPGSYLARDVNGHNPGSGYVRMALVAKLSQCLEAAHRIAAFCQTNTPKQTP